MCRTIKYNKSYKECDWIETDPEVCLADPGERLNDYIRAFYNAFDGEPTLYIIDGCVATKALTKKRDMLSELAFSGRHAMQSCWIVSQKYNSILTDFREQTKWLALFHRKGRESFEECLRENDVIPRKEKNNVRKLLAETKHTLVILKIEQPAA